MKLEDALVAVWRQALEENANIVELEGQRYPVRRTARKRLRQVDFSLGGQLLRGIEQNPETASRWAKLAREGHRVMQFTTRGRYIANVVDGKVNSYQKTSSKKPAVK